MQGATVRNVVGRSGSPAHLCMVQTWGHLRHGLAELKEDVEANFWKSPRSSSLSTSPPPPTSEFALATWSSPSWNQSDWTDDKLGGLHRFRLLLRSAAAELHSLRKIPHWLLTNLDAVVAAINQGPGSIDFDERWELFEHIRLR